MKCYPWKYEFIFVDDGSTDASFKLLEELQYIDESLKIIKLEKNFGQSVALLTGLEHIHGEVIISIDADLQNDTYDIPKLIQKIDEGYEVVCGWRVERRDPLIRKAVSSVANWLISKKTGVRLHDYGCALCAMKKSVIARLNDYGNYARFIKPLLVNLTDKVCEVSVRHHPRKRGHSKYNIFKIIKEGLDFMNNFPTDLIKIRKKIKGVVLLKNVAAFF